MPSDENVSTVSCEVNIESNIVSERYFTAAEGVLYSSTAEGLTELEIRLLCNGLRQVVYCSLILSNGDFAVGQNMDLSCGVKAGERYEFDVECAQREARSSALRMLRALHFSRVLKDIASSK